MKIAVIGGGIVGLTIAKELLDAGFGVHVFEKHTIGSTPYVHDDTAETGQSTTRSLGALLPFPYSNTHRMPCIQRRSLSLLWPRLVKSLARHVPNAADAYHPYPRLHLFPDNNGVINGQRTVDASGGRQRMLSGKEAQEVYPHLQTEHGGYVCLASACLDVAAWMHALLTYVKAEGGEISEQAELADINAPELKNFDAVVVAAGIWSTDFLRPHPNFNAAKHTVSPVKGQGIHVTFPAEYPVPQLILQHKRTYIIPTGTHSALLGSTAEEQETQANITPAAQADILARASALYPPVRHARVTHQWAGFRPRGAKIDGQMQLMQRLDDRTILAAGHFKIGLCLAPAAAEAVVRALR